MSGSKIRAMLGLTLMGGTVGAVFGAFGNAALRLIELGPRGLVDGWALVMITTVIQTLQWGGLGAFTGAAFAVVLATVPAARGLDRWTASALGAVAGAAFVPLIGVFDSGLSVFSRLGDLLPSMGLTAAFGGVLVGALVSVAQRADESSIGSQAPADSIGPA